jgi:biopolymer transport protein ExbB/TolQ
MSGLFGTFTAAVFTSLMFIIFIWAIVVMTGHADRASDTAENVSGLLTTLGLFGTFWGIAQSLGSFNVNDMDGSVPLLLEGMKLAFWTSILGMFSGMILRALDYFVFAPLRSSGKESGVTADDIYRVMTEQRDAINSLKNITASGGDALSNAIRQIDCSVLAQMKQMSGDSQVFQETIVREFRDFTQTMAKNNSDALINALQEVIKDFNAKINEQFGENFKELNRAVAALLQWQENYRVQMEETTRRFQSALIGIDASQKAIERIRRDTEAIPCTMEQLRGILQKLDFEMEKAGGVLEGFAALRTRADEVFPVIESALKNLTETMTKSVAASAEQVESIVAQQGENVKVLRAQLSALTLQSCDMVQKGMEDIQVVFEKNLQETMKLTKSNFEEFDRQMGSELERAIRLLGSQLASVAKKLVDDYTALEQKIDSLVSRALSVPDDRKGGPS